MKRKSEDKILQILLLIGMLGSGGFLYGADVSPSAPITFDSLGQLEPTRGMLSNAAQVVTGAVFAGMENFLAAKPVESHVTSAHEVSLAPTTPVLVSPHFASSLAACANGTTLEAFAASAHSSCAAGAKKERTGIFPFLQGVDTLTPGQKAEVQRMLQEEIHHVLMVVDEHVRACNKELVKQLFSNSEFATRMVGVAFQDAIWSEAFWKTVAVVACKAEQNVQEEQRQQKGRWFDCLWCCCSWLPCFAQRATTASSQSAQLDGLETSSSRLHSGRRISDLLITSHEHGLRLGGEIRNAEQVSDVHETLTAALPSLMKQYRGSAKDAYVVYSV